MKIEILEGGGAGVEKGMLDIAGLRHHKALDRRCCDRRFWVSRLSRKGCNEWQRGNDIADISVRYAKTSCQTRNSLTKGSKPHICKKCARKPKEQHSEEITITRIYSVLSYHNLSRDTSKDAGEILPKHTRAGSFGGTDCARRFYEISPIKWD